MCNIKKIFLFIIVFILSSCASFGPQGIMYYGREVAISTNNNVKSTKVGTACMKSYAGLILNGDASISHAMESGVITKVASVSYKISNHIVYEKYCTIVRGE